MVWNAPEWSGKGKKWSKMVNNGLKWSKMVKYGQKWFKMVRNCPKWSEIVRNGQKGSRIVQNGLQLSSMVYPKLPHTSPNFKLLEQLVQTRPFVVGLTSFWACFFSSVKNL